MNQELFKFNVGKIASSELLSSQCLTIRNVFFSTLTDTEKLERILELLRTEIKLDDDTHILLKRGIRGSYGSENLVLDVDSLTASKFWLGLHQLFPDDPDFMLLAADANFTSIGSNEEVYGPLFIKGMQMLGNVYDVGGEVGSVLLKQNIVLITNYCSWHKF